MVTVTIAPSIAVKVGFRGLNGSTAIPAAWNSTAPGEEKKEGAVRMGHKPGSEGSSIAAWTFNMSGSRMQEPIGARTCNAEEK